MSDGTSVGPWGGARETTAAPDLAYGGLVRRTLAMIVDLLVIGVLEVAAYFAVILARVKIPEAETSHEAFAVGLLAAGWLVPWIYCAGLEASRLSATLGKALLGLAVTHLDGRPLSFWRASSRHFVKILSAPIVFFGGFAMTTGMTVASGMAVAAAGVAGMCLVAAFTPRRQAVHDLVAGSVVVRRGGRTEGEDGAGPRWTVRLTPIDLAYGALIGAGRARTGPARAGRSGSRRSTSPMAR